MLALVAPALAAGAGPADCPAAAWAPDTESLVFPLFALLHPNRDQTIAQAIATRQVDRSMTSPPAVRPPPRFDAGSRAKLRKVIGRCWRRLGCLLALPGRAPAADLASTSHALVGAIWIVAVTLAGSGSDEPGRVAMNESEPTPQPAPAGALCCVHAGRNASVVCSRCGDFACAECAGPSAGMLCAACRARPDYAAPFPFDRESWTELGGQRRLEFRRARAGDREVAERSRGTARCPGLPPPRSHAVCHRLCDRLRARRPRLAVVLFPARYHRLAPHDRGTQHALSGNAHAATTRVARRALKLRGNFDCHVIMVRDARDELRSPAVALRARPRQRRLHRDRTRVSPSSDDAVNAPRGLQLETAIPPEVQYYTLHGYRRAFVYGSPGPAYQYPEIPGRDAPSIRRRGQRCPP